MKALLLAAGRGERMRPLSDHTPKPLLRAGEHALIEWQIMRLVQAGVRDIVINVAHQAAVIEESLGNGARFGAQILYSREGQRAEDALETLGGVLNALPLLDPGDAPFVVLASDLYTEYDYRNLNHAAQPLIAQSADAHLVMVDNPPYHPQGDLGLSADSHITLEKPWLTYASIGLFAPRLFARERVEKKRLFPWMHQFISQGRVRGEHFSGLWHNVGTPQDLAQLNAALTPNAATVR